MHVVGFVSLAPQSPVSFSKACLGSLKHLHFDRARKYRVQCAGVSYEAAESCQKEGMDSTPMAAAIAKTNALQPKHTWVPWVTVNDVAINPARLADATHVTKEVCMAYDLSLIHI